MRLGRTGTASRIQIIVEALQQLWSFLASTMAGSIVVDNHP